jgi:hypothetical protein
MRSTCCLCVCVPPTHNVARQRLSKHVPGATNARETIEELLDPVRVISYNQHAMK